MAAKALSVQPTIDPSAKLHDTRLGAYTEVGARTILHDVTMGDYSYVVNDAQITYTTIGKFCSIAAMTRINPGNHPMHRATQAHFTYRSSAYFEGESDDTDFFDWRRQHHVHIGHDVWIGHGAIVLPGRNIGTGAVIAAGAIVTKDVPAYTIVAGNPARIVRRRFSEEVAGRLARLAWWDWDHDKLRAALPDFRKLGIEDFLATYEARGSLQLSTIPLAANEARSRDRHFPRGRPDPDRLRVRRDVSCPVRTGHRRGRCLSRPGAACDRRAQPAGAAWHRRSAWRCLRAADDAARRGRLPDRRGARRQRPPGDRQRHHHGVSRHDLFVGAGPAQRRQCARPDGGDRTAASAIRRRHPLSSAPRDLQSRRRSRDRPVAH